MSDVSRYCAACECDLPHECPCSHTCAAVVDSEQGRVDAVTASSHAAGPDEHAVDSERGVVKQGFMTEPVEPEQLHARTACYCEFASSGLHDATCYRKGRDVVEPGVKHDAFAVIGVNARSGDIHHDDCVDGCCEGVNPALVDTDTVTGSPEAAPHVHEPAGPGEYCIGCLDQGVAWAMYDERARIRRIVEERRLKNEQHMADLAALGQSFTRFDTRMREDDWLLAAIDGGNDA